MEMLRHYEEVYMDIKKSGYDADKGAPITVNGGRGSALIRLDGAHRLAIASLLGVDRVLVRYHLIHPEHKNAQSRLDPN